jgi:hypothetical protein
MPYHRGTRRRAAHTRSSRADRPLLCSPNTHGFPPVGTAAHSRPQDSQQGYPVDTGKAGPGPRDGSRDCTSENRHGYRFERCGRLETCGRRRSGRTVQRRPEAAGEITHLSAHPAVCPASGGRNAASRRAGCRTGRLQVDSRDSRARRTHFRRPEDRRCRHRARTIMPRPDGLRSPRWIRFTFPMARGRGRTMRVAPSRQPLISGLPEEPDPRRQRYRSLVTVILVVMSAASMVAQEFRTSIRGHVLDSSKGALSGVTVTAPEHRNQRVAPAVSNAEGNYTIPFLRPGSYTLTGTLLGAGSFLISIYGEAPRTSFAL